MYWAKKEKKLVTVLVNSTLVIASPEASIKIALQRVPCIQYLVQFQGKQAGKIQVLIDSDSKVKKMTAIYAVKLGFTTRKMNVGA